MILKDKTSHIPWAIFKTSIEGLINAARELDSEKIQILLDQIIPTYSSRNFNAGLKESDPYSTRSVKAEA